MNLKADASPTKSFFVRMLTRDITLEDCILDLIDNSIDGAWALSGDHPTRIDGGRTLAGYSIEITISDDQFQISDNCGGISLEDAEKYAFTFGRLEENLHSDYSVGVYGIGLKRAVFKLGNDIQILSSFKRKRKTQAFIVPIVVSDWVERKEWDFEIQEITSPMSPGVSITVKDLTPATSEKFSDPAFVTALTKTVGRDYLLPLMKGLTIKINGVSVDASVLDFRYGGSFVPLRVPYEDQGVSVEVLAGMWANPPDDDGPEDSTRSDNTSGWYVFCNGRAVLAADRSSITGWGTPSLPKWHQQYGGFMGMCFFSSADASLLPMTTTKRSVDPSSGVYRRALSRMVEASRQWVDYTNERKHDPIGSKFVEDKTKSVPLAKVSNSTKLTLPRVAKRNTPKMANILFQMPEKRVRSLANALGDINLSYRDVGIQSFEYAYNDLVVEDD